MSVIQADAIQMWDKRPTETPRAFQMFQMYRDMGTTRSIRKLQEHTGISLSALARWSSQYDWVDRAGSWDGHVDRERQLQSVEDARAMQERHAAIATRMMSKALEKIRNIKPETLTVREAVMLMDLGVRIERRARGDVDMNVAVNANVEVRGPTGAAILKAIQASEELMEFADLVDQSLEADPTSGIPE